MPLRALANPTFANGTTAAFGLLLATVSETQVSQWSGLFLLGWAAVLEAYRRFSALRREEARADMAAKLADLKAEAVALEARIGGLRSELSGLEIARNQRFVETGE
ncbi:hypothetical protein [Paludisphaera rhizosphaerae]|uniref:hypothetical protein n=1 Tax=Paludisphaera rhizosphaerae TaxID=2711216 RepID=UPI0013EB144A|nr:hypothetical protein [Paludisphaera rhizosphaerae]